MKGEDIDNEIAETKEQSRGLSYKISKNKTSLVLMGIAAVTLIVLAIFNPQYTKQILVIVGIGIFIVIMLSLKGTEPALTLADVEEVKEWTEHRIRKETEKENSWFGEGTFYRMDDADLNNDNANKPDYFNVGYTLQDNKDVNHFYKAKCTPWLETLKLLSREELNSHYKTPKKEIVEFEA